MNRDHVPLTEAEWKIMLLLWEKSPRTMMELTRALAEDTGWSKHTVITMLKRMAVKGTVRICEDGPVKTYFPAVAKDLSELQKFLDRAEKQKKNTKEEPKASA